MIELSNSFLLFIQPSAEVSTYPVLDALTFRMTAALRKAVSGTWLSKKGQFRPKDQWMGHHTCACGVTSTSTDYFITGQITNSLCIHYLAFHREQIPASELEKVKKLTHGIAYPDLRELVVPQSRIASLLENQEFLAYLQERCAHPLLEFEIQALRQNIG